MSPFFGDLQKDGTVANSRTISSASLAACPHNIWVADHYREDETCRCDDPDHELMVEGGYVWSGSRWEAP
jgi:hypothetical protein